MALTEFTYANLKRKVIEYGAILPQVTKLLLQLLLVVPATSATSEQSFSSLRLLKTFLRTTMSQSRLKHLMLLYVHEDYTIDRKAAITEFITSNSERKQTFAIPV